MSRGPRVSAWTVLAFTLPTRAAVVAVHSRFPSTVPTPWGRDTTRWFHLGLGVQLSRTGSVLAQSPRESAAGLCLDLPRRHWVKSVGAQAPWEWGGLLFLFIY